MNTTNSAVAALAGCLLLHAPAWAERPVPGQLPLTQEQIRVDGMINRLIAAALPEPQRRHIKDKCVLEWGRDSIQWRLDSTSLSFFCLTPKPSQSDIWGVYYDKAALRTLGNRRGYGIMEPLGSILEVSLIDRSELEGDFETAVHARRTASLTKASVIRTAELRLALNTLSNALLRERAQEVEEAAHRRQRAHEEGVVRRFIEENGDLFNRNGRP